MSTAHSHYGYVFKPSERSLEGDGNGVSVRRIRRLEFGSGDWVEYELETSTVLGYVDLVDQLRRGPPYGYRIIARQRKELTLIAAESRAVIHHALERLWAARGFRRWEVRVHALVGAIMDKRFSIQEGTGAKLVPCLSHLHARTTGYAPQVETASFQGADLSASVIITPHRTKIIFRRCGLRLPSESYERARIAVDGAIDFHPNALHGGATADGGTHIEELLLDLIAGGYLPR